jgi:hypothetical protein
MRITEMWGSFLSPARLMISPPMSLITLLLPPLWTAGEALGALLPKKKKKKWFASWFTPSFVAVALVVLNGDSARGCLFPTLWPLVRPAVPPPLVTHRPPRRNMPHKGQLVYLERYSTQVVDEEEESC